MLVILSERSESKNLNMPSALWVVDPSTSLCYAQDDRKKQKEMTLD